MAKPDQQLQGFEEAFFAAGDALVHQPVAAGAEYHETPVRLRLKHADLLAARIKTAAALQRARRWLRWNGHIVGFRARITTCAEPVRKLATLRVLRRPLVAVRHPWLARACVVVLISAGANYAAAVLAASGVL